MKILLLDDLRNLNQNEFHKFFYALCQKHGYTIVRTYWEFTKYIDENGIPDVISFDHDISSFDTTIGREMTGLHCVHYLCNYVLDRNKDALPKDFMFFVHSANPAGAKNIEMTLSRFVTFVKEM